MLYENIDKMISGELEHDNIFLGEQISDSSINSPFNYGEYNGNIVEAINDNVDLNRFTLICDNVLKFIEYKPSKKETKDYKSIIQKEINFKFSFSYYLINKAFNEKDNEILLLEYNRLGNDLNKLINDPYYMFNKEDKGIIYALLFYIHESIIIFTNTYLNDKVDDYLSKYKQLKNIYKIN